MTMPSDNYVKFLFVDEEDNLNMAVNCFTGKILNKCHPR